MVGVVDLARDGVNVGGVWTVIVVEGEVGADLPEGVHHRFVALQANLLVIEAAPQPLDEDVAQAPALAGWHSRRSCNPSKPSNDPPCWRNPVRPDDWLSLSGPRTSTRDFG